MSDALGVAGAILAVTGVALWSIPAALVLAGVLLALLGWRLA